ncbi:MAG: hypothetical protein LIO43_03415, partial [Clostridiales bacterium]|nr:hypothetical protein [Clostridiales bacterium]
MQSKLVKFLCVVLSVMFVFASAFTAQAASSSSKMNEIENRLEKNKKELANLKSQQADAEEYANVLMQKVDLLKDKISTLQDQK